MKLPGIDNVYGKTGELNKAIRSELIRRQFYSIKDFENAVKVVQTSFEEGMNKGYSGQPIDIANFEQFGLLAIANPQTGNFDLFRRIG